MRVTHNLRADTITITGFNDDEIEAYLAVPTDVESVGSMIIIHHMPGYDEGTKEIARRFAANGYAALIPNLYYRVAPGASPDDAAATQRSLGGVPDDQLVGDAQGAMNYLKALPISNGKVGVIGYCSGGRQSFLVGLRLPVNAVIDCYGAFVAVDPPSEYGLKMKSLDRRGRPTSGSPARPLWRRRQNPTPEQNQLLADALDRGGQGVHVPHL